MAKTGSPFSDLSGVLIISATTAHVCDQDHTHFLSGCTDLPSGLSYSSGSLNGPNMASLHFSYCFLQLGAYLLTVTCPLQTLTTSQGTTQRPSRLVFTDVAKALNAWRLPSTATPRPGPPPALADLKTVAQEGKQTDNWNFWQMVEALKRPNCSVRGGPYTDFTSGAWCTFLESLCELISELLGFSIYFHVW